jgi:hypothetical protein
MKYNGETYSGFEVRTRASPSLNVSGESIGYSNWCSQDTDCHGQGEDEDEGVLEHGGWWMVDGMKVVDCGECEWKDFGLVSKADYCV